MVSVGELLIGTPPLPFHPISPSLISLMVSVDTMYHERKKLAKSLIVFCPCILERRLTGCRCCCFANHIILELFSYSRHLSSCKLYARSLIENTLLSSCVRSLIENTLLSSCVRSLIENTLLSSCVRSLIENTLLSSCVRSLI